MSLRNFPDLTLNHTGCVACSRSTFSSTRFHSPHQSLAKVYGHPSSFLDLGELRWHRPSNCDGLRSYQYIHVSHFQSGCGIQFLLSGSAGPGRRPLKLNGSRLLDPENMMVRHPRRPPIRRDPVRMQHLDLDAPIRRNMNHPARMKPTSAHAIDHPHMIPVQDMSAGL
jgi:hypothetical protein